MEEKITVLVVFHVWSQYFSLRRNISWSLFSNKQNSEIPKNDFSFFSKNRRFFSQRKLHHDNIQVKAGKVQILKKCFGFCNKIYWKMYWMLMNYKEKGKKSWYILIKSFSIHCSSSSTLWVLLHILQT